MAGRVIGIEIGAMTTYVTELDFKVKTPKLYQAFKIDTPDDVLVDGSVSAVPEFIAKIKTELDKRSIKTKKVIFVMNSARIANREVSIPAVKENKIHELLISNSSEIFPVDLQQYQLVHKILEKDKEKNTIKLSILAVPNDIIYSYCNLAQAMGLELTALDYLGNSIAQGMLRMVPEPVKVTIKIDELSSFFTIINGDKIELQRNISYGIKEAVDTVAESGLFGENLSFHEAMDVMRRRTCMFRRLNDERFNDTETETEFDAKQLQTLREDVTENVRALVGNISRILDYYTSRNQETVITQIWLIGPGADCSGLSKLLTNELDIKVKPIQKLDEFSFSKSIETEHFTIAEYAALIAAVLNPLEFSLATAKGIDEKTAEKKQRELLIPGIVCGGLVLLAAGLTAYSLISSFLLQRTQKNLNTRIEALQDAQTVYDTYLDVKSTYDGTKELYAITETPDDAFLAFLDEMEEKMPSDMVVSGLNAEPEGISMNITVPSKQAAAKVLMQLRTFSTLSYVSTAGVSDSEDDSGISSVNFSVTCLWKGSAPEETESQSGEAAALGSEEENAEDLNETETTEEGSR